MSKYQVKRPRHLGEIKRLDEQTRVPDLPAAAAAHEAPKLLLIGPSLPPRVELSSSVASPKIRGDGTSNTLPCPLQARTDDRRKG
jgi:hypothetical protein